MIRVCDVLRIVPDPPVFDLALFAVYVVYFGMLWRNRIGHQGDGTVPDVSERSLGAQTSLSAVTGSIIAATILFGFVTLFASGKGHEFESFRLNVVYAAGYAITTVLVAAYTLGMIPPQVSRIITVTSFPISLLSTVMLFWLVFAGIRFGYAFALLLYPECLCGTTVGPPATSELCKP